MTHKSVHIAFICIPNYNHLLMKISNYRIEKYDHCRENAAMLEIFYEALNFETLTESEAYGVVKMLADFGGQLGLWSGVSVMTICEFVCLACELIYMFTQLHLKKYRMKKSARENE
ncbi:Deproteinrin mec-10 [Parelaphostrongylus tenuis]|uniref:Deproteinrin mec-10 n=1 Tax=Parelaphostrongylus tenuis TaxID=148309 RepID=A0AAD5MMY7_PARTN|nr:Deproteinrin mec-10 [Parelaphostrongylus tenuis]